MEPQEWEKRLERAKKALREQIAFAAVLADGTLVTSGKKGIAPMMDLLQEDAGILRDACVADRVIGRAAALLMEKAGVTAAYGGIVSAHALRAFSRNGIPIQYGGETPYIINQTKTGMCPMEQTVLEIEDADTAYEALQRKLAQLRGKAKA